MKVALDPPTPFHHDYSLLELPPELLPISGTSTCSSHRTST